MIIGEDLPILRFAVIERYSDMSSNTPRPTPTSSQDRSEVRQRRSSTHDYWPRDFWDVAPDTGTEQRPAVSDWASL